MDRSAQPSLDSSPLEAILDRVASGPATVLFDLDSTLIDNRPRQAAIVRDFGTSTGEPLLSGVRARHFVGWDLRVALRNAGLPEEAAARLAIAARPFWRERFFTNDYCHHDVAVSGAPAYLEALKRAGARVVYLTGRPVDMAAGTLASLADLGFPVPDPTETTLLLKPFAELHDDRWKTEATAIADGLGPIVAAFDNEPSHINVYRVAWPKAVCVWLDTDHSGRPVALLPGIARVSSFERAHRIA